MRCAYLTTDEVNEALALDWAAASGINLSILAPKEGLPGQEYDAVLCDWDFWPVALREQMLADLRKGPPPCPWAVHGYNLDEEATLILRNQAVAVHHRLHLELFQLLRQATRRTRCTPSQVQGSGSYGKVDGERMLASDSNLVGTGSSIW